jgi:hypothetical protein
MNDNVVTAEVAGPLSPENYKELAQAQERAKKIRKAGGVANFNGWTTGIFAALSLPFTFVSVEGFLITLGLSIVAWNEFRGRKRMLNFDPSGPVVLGWNQVGFLALIVGYCCWSIYTGLNGSGELTKQLQADPELARAMRDFGDFEGLQRMLVLSIYGTVIVLSVFFQGFNALYYFSRRKLVVAYLQETPAWVLELQRSAAAG